MVDTPGVSLMNPGQSLHFDGQALQDNEEDEYRREEEEKQNELRELLANSAFDDILDDDSDNSSLSSHVSHDSGAHSDEKGPQKSHWSAWPSSHHLQMSTPIGGNPPPLKTPATNYPHRPYNTYHGQKVGWIPDVHDNEYHRFGNEQYPVESFGERGQIPGSYDDDEQYNHNGYQHYHDNEFAAPHPQYNGYNKQNQDWDGYQSNQYPQDYPDKGYGVPVPYQNAHQDYPCPQSPQHSPGHTKTIVDSPLTGSIREAPLGGSEADTAYKVQYTGWQSTEQNEPVQDNQTNKVTDLQQEFLNTGGTGENRQLEQLQILYKARGRQIEQLNHDLAIIKEDDGREIRMLKHQLALSQGEKEGMSGSYTQCQELLQEAKQENTELNGKVMALQNQVDMLTRAKNELIQKLQAAETTIETLNQQMYEIQSSESLTRARDQHQSIINNMQHKYDEEILQLKERLDSTQSDISYKSQEVANLRTQLTNAIRRAEDAEINRADTINRLTRSLEDSQRQCQDLLQSGSSAELTQLRIQMQQMVTSRDMGEDMYRALQAEVTELTEQLTLYESASTLGIYPCVKDDGHSESFSQLGIRKNLDGWQTPNLHTVPPPTHDDSSVNTTSTTSLKTELQKSLAALKSKRDANVQLQKDLRNAKTQVDDLKSRLELSEKKVQEQEVKISQLERQLSDLQSNDMGVSGTEMRLQKELDISKRERSALFQELEDVKRTLEEVASDKERLEEINTELNEQMAQMVKDYDEDKKVALERCQNACMKHHEEAKDKLRSDLMSEFNDDRSKLTEKHLKEISNIRTELEDVSRELMQVKETYLKVCDEKNLLEQKITREVEEKFNQDVVELKANIEKEKLEEFEQMKKLQDEENSSEENKEKLLRNLEPEMNRRIEAAVAMAKIRWFEEQRKDKETAVQTAVSNTQKEMEHKQEVELEKQIDKRIEEAKSNWQTQRRLSFENELLRRIKSEREKWQVEFEVEKKDAIRTALVEAKHDWIKSNDNAAEIEKLKVDWLEKHNKNLTDEVTKRLQVAETEWKKKQSSIIEQERCLAQEVTRNEMNERIKQAKEEIENLKQQKQKQQIEKNSEIKTLESKKAAEIANTKSQYKECLENLKKENLSMIQALNAAREVKDELELAKQVNNDLTSKLEEKERLLKSADEHFQGELKKLQTELDEEYNKRLKQETSKLKEQHEGGGGGTLTQKLISQLHDVESQLRTSKEKHEYEINQLKELLKGEKEGVANVEKDFNAQMKRLEQECNTIVEAVQADKNKVAKELEKCTHELKSERDALNAKIKMMNKERDDMVVKYEERFSELSGKFQKLQNILRQRDSTYKEEYNRLKEKMEGKQKTACEMLNNKMMAMKQNQEAAIKTLHLEQNQRLMESQRVVSNTPTQTDELVMDPAMLKALKKQYLDTVAKMREDLIKHADQTNQRAKATVKSQIAKERQITASNLRKYYLKCFHQVLDETDCPNKQDKVSKMELLLQKTPDMARVEFRRPGQSSTVYERGSTPMSDDGRESPSQLISIHSNSIQSFNVVARTINGSRGSDINMPDFHDLEHPLESATNDQMLERSSGVASRDQSGAMNSNIQANRSKCTGISDNRREVEETNMKVGFEYTPLQARESTSYDSVLSTHISADETGLSYLPQEPRRYNPQPEKPWSPRSRSTSPAEHLNYVDRPSQEHSNYVDRPSQESRRQEFDDSVLFEDYGTISASKRQPNDLNTHRTNSQGDNISSGYTSNSAFRVTNPMAPLKGQHAISPVTAQTNSQSDAVLHKPMAMVTRTTQVPSPGPSKFTRKK